MAEHDPFPPEVYAEALINFVLGGCAALSGDYRVEVLARVARALAAETVHYAEVELVSIDASIAALAANRDGAP